MLRRVLIILAALSVGAAAHAAPPSKSLSTSDKKFITSAAQGGMLEVQLGNLASQKATSPDVKSFGQRMVTDHSKLNDQLSALAQQKGVTLATTLDKSHQADYDKLNKLSGTAFDRQYVRAMVSDHEQDAKSFAQEAKSAQDPDLRTYAQNSLPTIQDHLRMAQELAGKMPSGVGGAGTRAPEIPATPVTPPVPVTPPAPPQVP